MYASLPFTSVPDVLDRPQQLVVDEVDPDAVLVPI